MIHELDNAVRHYAETRLPRPCAVTPAAISTATAAVRTPPHRRCDGARLGIHEAGRAMHPAAIRVLETTWRVWREPLA